MTRPGTILLLLLTLCSGGCQAVQKVSDYFSGNTPGRYARMMEDEEFADNRRKGINGLVARDFARRPPYTTRYQQIAQNDPDPLVRATAIRALNRARDKTQIPMYVKALDDDSELVRLEAAKALVNMPDESAITPLEKIVNRPDENRDVRIAATDALRHYRNQEVARTLIAQLNERDFGVAWQAHRSLKKITGRDLRYDASAWLGLISGPDKPLG
jgi:HEAT repeat protein